MRNARSRRFTMTSLSPARRFALSRLHRLPIHDHHRRAGATPGGGPRRLVDTMVQKRPYTCPPPRPEVVVHGRPKRVLARQQAPSAASAKQVEDGVQHAAQTRRARTPAGPSRRQMRFHQRSRHIAHVRAVQLAHDPLLPATRKQGRERKFLHNLLRSQPNHCRSQSSYIQPNTVKPTRVERMLKKLVVTGLMLGPGPLLASQQTECLAIPQPLPSPLSAWSDRAVSVEVGERVSLGEPKAVTLVPLEEITWLRTPERPPAPDSLGVMLAFDIERAGNYSVAVDDGAWIDVVGPNGLVRSTNHGHGPNCSGIRKIVDFRLEPGSYALQISNSRNAIVRLLVANR